MSEPSQSRRTPLYDFHIRHGARIVEFAGWEMPVQYSGIIAEHKATRQAAGLFDVSHMGEARVSGPGALASLEKIMTNKMADLPIGAARYSLMCYDNGTVVDDVIVYRMTEQEFFICLNAGNAQKDVAWLKAHCENCTVTDETTQWAQLAVQGPLAIEILQQISDIDLSAIKRFHFAQGTCAGVPVLFSRTGYTGEDGLELYIPAAAAEKIAEQIIAAGAPKGLLPVGLGARDSLRLEAGYPLYGHEISDAISPLTAGLGWVVKLDKGDFIGRSALQQEKQQGSKQRLVFFKLTDRRIARQGMEIVHENNTVGQVCSGTLSPVTNQPIGSALVNSDAFDKPLGVLVRGQAIPLVLSKPPLHK